MKKELKIFATFVGIFLVAYFLPLNSPKIKDAILEAFKLLQWYARNHTLACVVPALFIAGGIITFLSKESVLRHLGPKSNKVVAYSVASVSGSVLAVCSCSVLPMFAGIYKLGAGLGPASAFLYSGPAINILAIFLTARVLGFEIGLGRAIGAVAFAFVIGILMAVIFRKEERARGAATPQLPASSQPRRRLWKNAAFLSSMIMFLIFSDWYNPGDAIVHMTDGTALHGVVLRETHDDYVLQVQDEAGNIQSIDNQVLPKDKVSHIEEVRSWVTDVYNARWYLAGIMGLGVALMAWRWYDRSEIREWMQNTWGFSKMLVPLLFGGVFVVGFIEKLLPQEEVARLVGDNSLLSNLIASVVGALFYFATLTEIPILQALMKNGMHQGPALALLLAGPALSLPSMLVIRKVMGNAKAAVFIGLTVGLSTVVGMLFGWLA
jgi:uncharacterized membrane protein YraQ (UPF0718 family)